VSALYWPDLDCTPASRAIEHELTVHQHFADEHAACLAFLGYRAATPGYPPPNLRYRCIRGPRGIVRGVIGDDGNRLWFL
jgi:hypothetical protein